MKIKINPIGVLLFVLAIVVFAGALNDLKYYEFEYFNLQELVISALILLAFWILTIFVNSIYFLIQKGNKNEEFMEGKIRNDVVFARIVEKCLEEHQSMIEELKKQLFDIQNKK